MADLRQQLDGVLAGHITALTPEQVVEGISEVYALATSLRADFRPVEDSWRDGNANLLNTQEGHVFDGLAI